ncbi:endonuclease III domain-containing protein [Thermovenabulum gondwanense]|uniref:Ultraviolet N-glycosylase/AP lyase n=1 Tax=Thermovenabulum gondwanense TaxID=520767 RepID=A0A162MIG1_9FIRM|nr:endonuclease [Thermovenabulum gondwanense]KYO66145.1 Ultraviolet N-glycosylase/AP lyase [Thermovenabulum gondwanense]
MENNIFLAIFEKLFEAYGPQHWWPAGSDFETVVGAILTQSVSWSNVEKAIKNLKREDLLSPRALSEIDDEKLHGLIRSTRFYKQKGERLKNFCRYLLKNYDGSLYRLFDKDVYELREELLGLKGLGEETVDSIILYAAKKPIFVVDAYTKRIFCRLGIITEDIDYKSLQKLFMSNLPLDTSLFNEYHALIVKLGKEVCRTKPGCGFCPLSDLCKEVKK